MPQWIFTLKGEHRDLEDLPNQFSASHCRVVAEQGRYNLTSTKLNEIIESHDVLAKAQNMLAMMRSSIQLRFGFVSKIEVDGVTKIDEDGRRTGFIFPDGIASTARVGIPTLIAAGAVPAPLPPPATESDIDAAQRDPKVAKALRIFGSREPTWHNLSDVLDVIQSDVGGKITKAGWAMQVELDRFTHTANSAQAVGDDARHGHEKFQPPPKPMSPAEAKDLITRILKSWLDSK